MDSSAIFGIDLGASQISVFLLQNEKKSKLSFGNQNFISSTLGYYNDKFIIGNDVLTMTPNSKLTIIANWKSFIGHCANDNDDNEEKVYTLESTKGVQSITANECLYQFLYLLFDYIRSEYHIEQIDRVCIPKPVNFTSEKQKIVEDTVFHLGVPSFKHLCEPVAVALSCSLTASLVLIFDFGGSTFDAAILERISGRDKYKIKESASVKIGGNDITEAFCDSQLNGQLKEYKESLMQKKNYSKFYQAMDRIKIILSDYAECEFAPYNLGIRHCEEEVIIFKQEDLESAIMSIVNKVIDCVCKMKDVKKVEKVVMTGGSSQIPLVKTKLKSFINNDDLFQYADYNCAIAQGAIQYLENEYSPYVSDYGKIVLRFSQVENTFFEKHDAISRLSIKGKAIKSYNICYVDGKLRNLKMKEEDVQYELSFKESRLDDLPDFLKEDFFLEFFHLHDKPNNCLLGVDSKFYVEQYHQFFNRIVNALSSASVPTLQYQLSISQMVVDTHSKEYYTSLKGALYELNSNQVFDKKEKYCITFVGDVMNLSYTGYNLFMNLKNDRRFCELIYSNPDRLEGKDRHLQLIKFLYNEICMLIDEEISCVAIGFNR